MSYFQNKILKEAWLSIESEIGPNNLDDVFEVAYLGRKNNTNLYHKDFDYEKVDHESAEDFCFDAWEAVFNIVYEIKNPSKLKDILQNTSLENLLLKFELEYGEGETVRSVLDAEGFLSYDDPYKIFDDLQIVQIKTEQNKITVEWKVSFTRNCQYDDPEPDYEF